MIFKYDDVSEMQEPGKSFLGILNGENFWPASGWATKLLGINA